MIQHSCEYNWELVGDLCEAGIDCLLFDQPAVYDMPAPAEKLRQHRVGLFVPCDIQLVRPTAFSPPPEVESGIVQMRKIRPKFQVPSEDFFRQLLEGLFARREESVEQAARAIRNKRFSWLRPWGSGRSPRRFGM